MMIARAWVVPLFVSTVAFAGCVGENGPGALGTELDAPGDGAITLPWSLTDCNFLNAFVTVPLDALQAQLPEGWEVAGNPYLGIESFVCASGRGLDAEEPGLGYGSYFTSVTAPADLAFGEYQEFFYKWWVLVPDDARRSLFAEHGMHVETGRTEVGANALPVGLHYDAVLDPDGIGVHRMNMLVTESQGPSHGEWFAEFSPLGDGRYAAWESNYTIDWLDVGRGVVEVPAGSLAAEIIGGTTARANVIRGTWSFHDGSVALPPLARAT